MTTLHPNNPSDCRGRFSLQRGMRSVDKAASLVLNQTYFLKICQKKGLGEQLCNFSLSYGNTSKGLFSPAHPQQIPRPEREEPSHDFLLQSRRHPW